jgi:ATP-dependent Clp protease ATP-binding subunit ClpA
MYERFTDRARRVMVLSEEEARLLNSGYIGTEHLLLALIHEGQGAAAVALDRLGLELDDVRKQVEEMVGLGSSTSPPRIPFTPRAKKVIELALREALQLGHNYIGTEHILLGLVREGEGVAAQVLVKLGADLSRVRRMVIEVLSRYSQTDAVRAELDMTTTDGKPPEYLPDREPVTVRIDRFLVGDRPTEYVAVTREDDQKAWRVALNYDPLTRSPRPQYDRLVPFDNRTDDGSEAALSAAVDLVRLLREHDAARAKTTEALTAWAEGRWLPRR